MKTREQIIAENPIVPYLTRRGAEFRRNGKEASCLCPLHPDRSPSFRVNEQKKTWFCDPCGIGGSIIDLMMKLESLSLAEVMKRLGGESESSFESPPERSSRGKVIATYDYQNAVGETTFRVLRMEPKDFRQQGRFGDKWEWTMDGIERVLFMLPKVLKADFVWIVEGEKDALSLDSLGLTATCNPGGAGKWQDNYSESLRGKEVILCGDNDEPGKRHMDKVEAAISGCVKSTRRIALPEEFKDVTEFLSSFPTKASGGLALYEMAEQVEVLTKGMRIPIQSMDEMERDYERFATKAHAVSLNLATWIPGFNFVVRPIVPGEVVTIVAETGVGKTMLLQNLALHTRLQTLFFELELPGTLTFERFVGMATDRSGANVQSMYTMGERPKWRESGRLSHVHVCSQSRMPPAEIERIIRHAGLKTGSTPQLVLVDYVQLIRGAGKDRYEDASDAAEDLKVIAKATDTIIVMTSQVKRKGEKSGGEITLQDAKGSGSIENSSGLVLGAWRDQDDKFLLHIKVLKNTKGISGKIVTCRISEGSMLIEEQT